jgi:mRNA interferase HicA
MSRVVLAAARRGERRSQLPMHGSRKELGTKLVNKILKDLGLK